MLLLTVGSSAASGAGWYADRDAGIRFPRPFADGERKTPDQIRNLILARPGATLPEEPRYTSGLYSREGVPYILIWRRDESRPPTQAEIEQQGFDVDRQEMILSPKDVSGDNLKSRILVKALRDRTIYIGFYFKEDRDLEIFAALREGLEVEPEMALTFSRLVSGRPSRLVTTAMVLAAGALGGAVMLMISKRRKRSTRFT